MQSGRKRITNYELLRRRMKRRSLIIDN
jgi:hypothetical protein